MTKQDRIKECEDLINLQNNKVVSLIRQLKVDKYLYLIIGTFIGCGLTLIGIGIGLWTGVI